MITKQVAAKQAIKEFIGSHKINLATLGVRNVQYKYPFFIDYVNPVQTPWITEFTFVEPMIHFNVTDQKLLNVSQNH